MRNASILLHNITVDEFIKLVDEIISKRLDKSEESKNNKNGYLKRAEVAELLRVSLPTLHEWTKVGWLQSYKIGNRVLYKRNEIEERMNSLMMKKHKRLW